MLEVRGGTARTPRICAPGWGGHRSLDGERSAGLTWGAGLGTWGCGTRGATPGGAALRALPSYPPTFPSDQTGLKAIEITWEGRRTSAGAGLLKTVPPHRL